MLRFRQKRGRGASDGGNIWCSGLSACTGSALCARLWWITGKACATINAKHLAFCCHLCVDIWLRKLGNWNYPNNISDSLRKLCLFREELLKLKYSLRSFACLHFCAAQNNPFGAIFLYIRQKSFKFLLLGQNPTKHRWFSHSSLHTHQKMFLKSVYTYTEHLRHPSQYMYRHGKKESISFLEQLIPLSCPIVVTLLSELICTVKLQQPLRLWE